MEKVKLRDLLINSLTALYNAEKQWLKALPDLIKTVSSVQLGEILARLQETTEQQIERLDRIFAILDLSPKGKRGNAIDGLLKEAKEARANFNQTIVIDAALIASIQSLTHYFIANYGCVCTWANLLEMDEIAEILSETLEEEKGIDLTLTELADNECNIEAISEV